MVRVKNQQDFMDRMVGTGDVMPTKVDLSPEKRKAIDGSFVIMFSGSMNESTANRLKYVCSRFGTNENPTDIYLGLPSGEERPTLIQVGSINFTPKSFKELKGVFTQYASNTNFQVYNNGEFTPFSPELLLETVVFREPNKKEIII